jgi:tight adherence protein C
VVRAALLAGAVCGIGLFLLGFALIPRRASLTRQLAALDAGPVPRRAPSAGRGQESEVSRWIGRAIAKLCAEQGWEFRSLRSSLALAGMSFESYLASKVLLFVLGLLVPEAAYLALYFVAGVHLAFEIPVWVGLTVAVVFFFLPDLEVKQKADRARRDFRHAIGAFLDLVAMNLSGGRGVPEALMAASEIGAGPSMWRIRETLANARITGQTPWQALGALGEEIKVDELRDLSAALSLVAEDGAKVRESLTSRAASLRRRELTDLQGQAGEKSESMLVAQMLLCAAFLIFLMYPAIRALLGNA